MVDIHTRKLSKVQARKANRAIRAISSRRTAQEKADLLKRFAAALEEGQTLSKAAKSSNTTLRTIYKLDNQREAIQTHLMAETPEIGPNISEAIKILCTLGADDRSFREALFKFIVWTKWPINPIYHFSAVTNCIISYIYKSTGAICIADLPPNETLHLQKYLRLDVLSRTCSPDAMHFPYFKFWNIENANYNELDVLAEICWYMIADRSEVNQCRERPSVGKARFLLYEGAFGCKWKVSHSTFRKLWKEHALSCPFLYVERYHSSLNFDLDPNEPEFVQDVDALVAKRDDVRGFFANCRWAVQRVSECVDVRALKGFEFPQFPSGLAPQAVVPPILPSKLAAALRSYKSSFK